MRIQAVLYVPEVKPTMFELAADAASGGQGAAVALYSRSRPLPPGPLQEKE